MDKKLTIKNMILGAHQERMRQKKIKEIDEAEKLARQILQNNPQPTSKEISSLLTTLEEGDQMGRPVEKQLLRDLRRKRDEARQRELATRSDSEKQSDNSELTSIEREMRRINERIKQIDQKAAQTLLGKIQKGVAFILDLDIEWSTEKQELLRQLQKLNRRKEQIQRRR